ncbi:uncharacterized protein LOC110844474 [Folsomia candida]|nr:uncharacterized protein LOC110844474 [Folsomia candida]
MRWGNPLLSILLSLRYTTIHVVGQFSSSGPYKNTSHHSGDHNSNGYNHHKNSDYSDNFFNRTINCVDNNSTLCSQHYWQNNHAYQYKEPVGKYYNYGWSNNDDRFKEQTVSWLQHQPVYYYVDPMRSKVDKAHSSESHSESKGHHDSMSKAHGYGHETHQHKEKGWGWPHHQEHHHHHDKKKKKKKKGVLGKLLKKFKPHKKPEKLIWKEVPECDGFENFIKDLEIISWIFGWIGFAKATLGLLLHFLNQVYLTFSVIKVGLPERILTFIELQNPGTAPELLKMITEIIGLIDYVINLLVSYPLGNKIVIIESIAEVLTIISLALATITIFDDIVEEKVWTIFGIDLRELFEGYGCDNLFSKEKKIEQFFEKFNKW